MNDLIPSSAFLFVNESKNFGILSEYGIIITSSLSSDISASGMNSLTKLRIGSILAPSSMLIRNT